MVITKQVANKLKVCPMTASVKNWRPLEAVLSPGRGVNCHFWQISMTCGDPRTGRLKF